MLQHFHHNPALLAANLAVELAKRDDSLDLTELKQISDVLHVAVSSSVYTTRAKHVLSKPLRDRGLPVSGKAWRKAGIGLYALWQNMTPEQVEARMAELAKGQEGKWRATFPDDWDIDEAKLLALYQSSGALQANGIHAWNDLSLALRFWVAEVLAPFVKANGAFDWGGSDGVTCTFLRHHGATRVELIEPNQAARDFCAWFNPQLGFHDIATHEHPVPGKRYDVGVCTEVLEHVVNPPKMCREIHDMLVPGGICFITSSFMPTQDTHLKQNLKYRGKENELIMSAGLKPWKPANPAPIPIMPQWGFWQRPA
jgi:hypothetical protein